MMEYPGKVVNESNMAYWAEVEKRAADLAANPDARRRLRNRARHEIANDSTMRGAVESYVHYVIGTGPRMRIAEGLPENAAQVVERQFAAWLTQVKFRKKLRLGRKVKVQDGEAFFKLFTNPTLPGVQLDLMLIEADQVASPAYNFMPDEADGIVYDAYNQPRLYRVLRQHPSGYYQALALEADDIPAAQIIHWYREDRPGQSRGLPEIMAALTTMTDIRVYNKAVIDAATTAAKFAGVLETDMPPPEIEYEDEVEGDPILAPKPFDPVDVPTDAFLTLYEGQKLNQLKAEQPTTTYETFSRGKYSEAGRCLSIPKNIALSDSSGYNYSSAQLDRGGFFRKLKVEHQEIEEDIGRRLFDEWLQEAMRIPDYLPHIPNPDTIVLAWYWDGIEHADPNKEATAQEKRLKNRTTTLTEEYARQGKDVEEQFRIMAREKEMAERYGIDLPYAVTPDTHDPPDPSEEKVGEVKQVER